MAEPITCAACLAALCGAVAGPIMRACVDDVFPRLNDCLPGFLQRLFRGNTAESGTPAVPESRMPAVPESGTPAVPKSGGDPSKPESGTPAVPKSGGDPSKPESRGGPSNPSLPGPTNSDLINFARNLKIEHLYRNECWALVPYPSDPRFNEVAELLQVWFFYIETSINFLRLSANTKYRAYLIFKAEPEPESKGLDAILKVWFSAGTEKGEKYVCLKPTTSMPSSVTLPEKGQDGWMELELAQFTCDKVTNKEASIYIKDETEGKNQKKGLIIAGIEFRPV